MPNILFASNSISHFVGSEVRNEDWSYDPNRVPYALYTPAKTVCSSPIFEGTTSNETWFHFKCGMYGWYIHNDEPICEIVNAEGEQILLVSCRALSTAGYSMKFTAGEQTSTNTVYLPVLNSQMRTFDVRILYSELQARAELYVNEILILTEEFSVTEQEVPRYMRLGGGEGYGTTINGVSVDNFGMHFSEIIVADGDTRNARLDLLRPVAGGVYGNWNGPISSLADDDPTTGMTTTLPDQSQSTILTSYTGATNISNIVQVTTTVRGINSPDQLEHFIRMSGVDYSSDVFDIPFNKEYQVTDWVLNPATSQPWAADDIVNVEFGFKSLQS